MLALCTEKPKPIAQTFRRAIKLQITETSPCARVSRKAVCGPETIVQEREIVVAVIIVASTTKRAATAISC